MKNPPEWLSRRVRLFAIALASGYWGTRQGGRRTDLKKWKISEISGEC
jgi:hypothetical protein